MIWKLKDLYLSRQTNYTVTKCSLLISFSSNLKIDLRKKPSLIFLLSKEENIKTNNTSIKTMCVSKQVHSFNSRVVKGFDGDLIPRGWIEITQDVRSRIQIVTNLQIIYMYLNLGHKMVFLR